MKVTKLGIILAAKNLGTWLATMAFTDVMGNPAKFMWLLAIYALINVPSDLFLMNHASTEAAKK